MTRAVPILILLAAIVAGAVSFAGCGSASKKRIAEERRKANERIAYTSTGHALIIQDAKSIKDEGGKIRQLLGESPPNPPLIIMRVASIEESATRIEGNAKSADKFTTETKTALDAERKRADKAVEKSNKPFRDTLGWLVIIGLVGGAIGIAVTFAMPGMLAKGIVAGGWALALTAVALRGADFWIYCFFGGLCVIGLAWIVYRLFIEKRINHEMKVTGDVFKHFIPEEVRPRALAVVSAVVQSAPTEAMIDREQDKGGDTNVPALIEQAKRAEAAESPRMVGEIEVDTEPGGQ